jgi:hypothetical protein
LAGQTEELFIPGRLALPDRSEMLVFVAEKEDYSLRATDEESPR